MTKFNAKSVKTVSTGKVEFRVMVGEFIDTHQGDLCEKLTDKGYTSEMAEKIVDAVLGQVFGFLSGPAGKDE